MKKWISLISLILASNIFAATNMDIQRVGEKWASAIATRNPQQIVALYDKEAFLYATFQNVLESPKSILNYFIKLTKHQDLAVQFNKQNIRIYGDVAINSGLYTFTYQDHGKQVAVPGRYTFVYLLKNDRWIIIDHHSSVLPEKS